MSRHCPMEAAVSEAARRQEWTPELAAHAADCPSCAEVGFVSHHLQTHHEILQQAPLPDPGAVWTRAQIDRRREDLTRATRSIAIMNRIAGACAAGVGLGGAAWMWPRLQHLALGFLDSAAASTPGTTGAAPPVAVLLLSVAIIGSLMVSDMLNPASRS